MGPALGQALLSSRAIWVIGMHRSGTSLATGVLRLLGADVGPRDDLLPADTADNPTGYWERRDVIDLNNELLARLGGSSVAPPHLPAGWESRADLEDLRVEARRILGELHPAAVSAVKDPRLSLTLPFWRPLVDESAVIVCVRSPRDVAASLHARDPDGPFSRRDWTAVWHTYTAAAVENARGLPGQIIFYDDWFEHRDSQVAALSEALEALGQPVGDTPPEALDSFLAEDLRHHASTLDEAASDADSDPRARELYTHLRTGGPRTSVLMAAYNPEPDLLTEAVTSVLGQTVPDLELIVVDDGSERRLAEVLQDVRDPRLRLVRHKANRGLSAARNTALRLARAPLVSHLDSDDTWETNYLEHVLPAFADPRVGVVYTNATILEHPEQLDTYIFDPSPHPIDTFPKIAEQNPVPLLTATARTHAVRQVGGYARWLHSTQDYYLWCRLAAAGWRFVYVDRKLARYRWPVGARSMGSDRRRVERDELLMWASFFVRHPLTPGPRRQLRVRARRELVRLVRR